MKPKTRKNVKREIKKCRENGVTIEESELDDLETKLSGLYANLSLKYDKGAKLIFDPFFFNMLKTYASDKIKLFVAKKDGNVTGFSLSLRHKDILDVMMVGFNYENQTSTDFSYFNLCYYEPIKYALDSGVKKIYYRYMMEKMKLERGCKPEQTYYFIKYHNKLLRVLIGNVVKNPLFNYLSARLGKVKF